MSSSGDADPSTKQSALPAVQPTVVEGSSAPTRPGGDSHRAEYSPEPSVANGPLEAGTLVGEYIVDRLIGEGGFGEVYSARHPIIGKLAAIKILSKSFSSDPALSTRFVNEARAANTIRHRNIIDIFAFGRLPDERLYLVMELLEGEPLDEYLRRKGRIGVEEALELFTDVGKALDAAHAAGVVHRDLKPANVFLARDAEGKLTPKLLDFGIAKLPSEVSISGQRTDTGMILGTPWYMSPEQCRGEGVGAAADIYAFGVMIHRALTGRLPFDGKNGFDVAMAQTSTPPPAMSSVAQDLPPQLDAPVLHMLEKDASKRPELLATALEELRAAARSAELLGRIDTQAVTVVAAATPTTPARRWWPLGVAAALVSVVAGVVVFTESPPAAVAPAGAVTASAGVAAGQPQLVAEVPAESPAEPPTPTSAPADAERALDVSSPAASSSALPAAIPPVSPSTAPSLETPPASSSPLKSKPSVAEDPAIPADFDTPKFP